MVATPQAAGTVNDGSHKAGQGRFEIRRWLCG